MFIRIYYNGCFKDIRLSDIQTLSIGGSNSDDIHIADSDLMMNHVKITNDGRTVTMTCGGEIYLNGSQVFGTMALEPSQIFILSKKYKISMLVVLDYSVAAAVKSLDSKDVISIGRNEDNDIVINSPIVSGHHAIIEHRGFDYYIIDKKSMNGTYLNSQAIDESVLRDGDEIVIGDSLVTRDGNQLVVYGDSKLISAKKDEKSAQRASTLSFCSYCGTQLDEGASVCSYCGTRAGATSPDPVKSEPVAPVAEPTPVSYPDVTHTPATPIASEEPAPKKSKKGIIIIAVTIVVLGALIATGFFARDYIMNFVEDIKTEFNDKSSSKEKGEEKKEEEATPTPEPTPEPITELVDEDGVKFIPDLTTRGEIVPYSASLSGTTISLDGKDYTFPISIADLKADGWKLLQLPAEISYDYYSKNGIAESIVVTRKTTDGTAISELYISSPSIEFILPGGITNKSTAADVIEVYGNPMGDTKFGTATSSGEDSILYSNYTKNGDINTMAYYFTFEEDGTFANVIIGEW